MTTEERFAKRIEFLSVPNPDEWTTPKEEPKFTDCEIEVPDEPLQDGHPWPNEWVDSKYAAYLLRSGNELVDDCGFEWRQLPVFYAQKRRIGSDEWERVSHGPNSDRRYRLCYRMNAPVKMVPGEKEAKVSFKERLDDCEKIGRELNTGAAILELLNILRDLAVMVDDALLTMRRLDDWQKWSMEMTAKYTSAIPGVSHRDLIENALEDRKLGAAIEETDKTPPRVDSKQKETEEPKREPPKPDGWMTLGQAIDWMSNRQLAELIDDSSRRWRMSNRSIQKLSEPIVWEFTDICRMAHAKFRVPSQPEADKPPARVLIEDKREEKEAPKPSCNRIARDSADAKDALQRGKVVRVTTAGEWKPAHVTEYWVPFDHHRSCVRRPAFKTPESAWSLCGTPTDDVLERALIVDDEADPDGWMTAGAAANWLNANTNCELDAFDGTRVRMNDSGEITRFYVNAWTLATGDWFNRSAFRAPTARVLPKLPGGFYFNKGYVMKGDPNGAHEVHCLLCGNQTDADICRAVADEFDTRPKT